MTNLTERLRQAAPRQYVPDAALMHEAADTLAALEAELAKCKQSARYLSFGEVSEELAELRRNTGGLDGALVAKALACFADGPGAPALTSDEWVALRAATFEATE